MGNRECGIQLKLRTWNTIKNILAECKIEEIVYAEAIEYSNKTWKRNHEYREKLKAGA